MNSDVAIDKAETLLAYLLCMDSPANPLQFEESSFLGFDKMSPAQPYTHQLHGERIFTTNPTALIAPVPDLLGELCEIALLCDGYVKWMGFRRMKKAPRGCWAPLMRPVWYQAHYMEIKPDGATSYETSVAAMDRAGNPVSVCFSGKGTRGSQVDTRTGQSAVIAASCVDDAHRPDALLATVKDSISIRTPVPIGEHKELFALRDAPLTPAGRRKAIIHWVVKHTRAARNERCNVKAHWRGARSIEIEGLSVTLAPNVRGNLDPTAREEA